MPSYSVPNSLPDRVANLNVPWNEEATNEEVQTLFMKAVEMTSIEFIDRVNFYARVWLPARSIVSEALDNKLKVHSSGKIILLERTCIWKQHFFDIEDEQEEQIDVYFVIFKSDESFRIQSVPTASNSFTLRIPLAKEWNGLRDQKLCDLVGRDDCIFVHANGFIGGAKSLETAIFMAAKTLDMYNS